MNIREQRKKQRINSIKKFLEDQKEEDIDIDGLVAAMIVNHGISRRTALEEINAVRKFLNG